MSQGIDSVLRGMLERHGTVLLDDHRRCEASLRDTQITKPEFAGVIGALRSGIVAQLRQFQAAGLTELALSNYAARLADETGLDRQLARKSVAAWAYALRVDVPGVAADPPPPPPDRKTQARTDRPPGQGDAAGGGEGAAPVVRDGNVVLEVLKRVGVVLYFAAGGAVVGTIFTLVFGFVKVMLLGGGGSTTLATASVFGIGWFGAISAVVGALAGREFAEEAGREPRRGADAAAWTVAAIVALLCLSVLFRT